jgi:GNAT superfamily N-acetyltransferase
VLTTRELGTDDPPSATGTTPSGRPTSPTASARGGSRGRRPGRFSRARPAGRTAYRIVAAFDGDDLVGGAELSQPLVHDTETMSVVLGVLPGHRRRGAGALLMTEVRAIAREHGRSILQTEVTVPDGVAFESWCGGAFAGRQGMRSVSAEDRMLVDLPFDPARLDRIVAGVPACRRAGVPACRRRTATASCRSPGRARTTWPRSGRACARR